jgi:hypothetical protein
VPRTRRCTPRKNEALRTGRSPSADGASLGRAGRALSPSLYERLKHLHHPAHGACGPNKHFALDPAQIPRAVLLMLVLDVAQPNGCNACPKTGEVAAWVAPGDLCDLLDMGLLDNMLQLRHCGTK